jgi:hypothetical protein
MTADEIAVLSAMRDGDLAPLADLLALEGDMHPMIQRELRIMITGWAKRDFRVVAQLAPGVHPKTTKVATRAQRQREIALTVRALELGAADRSRRDRAVEDAVKDLGLDITPATALDWYKRRSRGVRLLQRMTAKENQGAPPE